MSQKTLRGFDLNLLVVMQALLETRNATRAAERLNMTQPAVSRALGRLRHTFKDRLFLKGARGLIATPRAEALVASLIPLMGEISDLVDGPRFDALTTDRVFKIVASDYGALAFAPALAEIFAREAPNAGIELTTLSKEAFRRLAGGEFDLALYSNDPVPDGLATETLFEETYATLARAGHPIRASVEQGRIRLDAFLEHPHALVSVMGGRTGVLDEALARIGKTRRIAMWLPYFVTAALVAARTDIIVTLPRRATVPLAQSGNLVALDPPVEIESFGYQMVWHPRTNADPGSIWMREAVRAAAHEAG